MATVNPGYMGYAKFGTSGKIRFESCTVAAKQEINAPDLITGHWNRQAYNYGKAEISGTISGPVTENFAGDTGSVWNLAVDRSPCGELTETSLDILYYCSGALYIFDPIKMNSVTFSCAAGEVAQFSVDVIGAKKPNDDGTGEDVNTDAEKLITWDKVDCSVTTPSGQTFNQNLFSNFEVTFGNNVEAVYALGNDAAKDLYPHALVDGITTITGSVSAYNVPTDMRGRDAWGDYEADQVGTITFDVGGGPITLNVQWHRVEPTSSVGPLISTVAFTGVTTQTI